MVKNEYPHFSVGDKVVSKDTIFAKPLHKLIAFCIVCYVGATVLDEMIFMGRLR